ncbi:hypothetical protein IFM89_022179 [Coptis chinensis]|uniref:Uncharacterized protein n=1 Tax=Coptis chinensis TaxID=261450 RepID=A0A835GXA1_9MAGN|nr:hypothetical protein IFM89_022179 [Coptis chinensis]
MAEQQHRRRLVLFPSPLQGHINPMLQLATILHSHSKGALSITIIHIHFNSPNPSNYPNFTFLPISDGLSQSQRKSSTEDLIAFATLLNLSCVNPFRDCLVNKILSQQHEPPVACIISDSSMHFTQPVADSLQLPCIGLRTKSELEAPVRELPPLKVKDLPVVKTHNLEAFYQLVADMVKQTKASAGLIVNSFESLDQSAFQLLSQEFAVPIFPIGPFKKFGPASSSSLLTQDQSCISWLNKQPPSSVVYISFGSAATISEAQLVEIAMGLANSEQSFLWVIRPGSVVGSCRSDDDKDKNEDDKFTELLPQKFNEIFMSGRGCIVKWAPQEEVLAHPSIGGFWTHSGWNSTLESICEGVPMLCWPCFGDQKVNARFVSKVWRVGLQLENGLEREEIERSLRRLMMQENNKEREELMVRAKDLKEMAELCQREGGSSFQSLQNLIDYIFSRNSDLKIAN